MIQSSLIAAMQLVGVEGAVSGERAGLFRQPLPASRVGDGFWQKFEESAQAMGVASAKSEKGEVSKDALKGLVVRDVNPIDSKTRVGSETRGGGSKPDKASDAAVWVAGQGSVVGSIGRKASSELPPMQSKGPGNTAKVLPGAGDDGADQQLSTPKDGEPVTQSYGQASVRSARLEDPATSVEVPVQDGRLVSEVDPDLAVSGDLSFSRQDASKVASSPRQTSLIEVCVGDAGSTQPGSVLIGASVSGGASRPQDAQSDRGWSIGRKPGAGDAGTSVPANGKIAVSVRRAQEANLKTSATQPSRGLSDASATSFGRSSAKTQAPEADQPTIPTRPIKDPPAIIVVSRKAVSALSEVNPQKISANLLNDETSTAQEKAAPLLRGSRRPLIVAPASWTAEDALKQKPLGMEAKSLEDVPNSSATLIKPAIGSETVTTNQGARHVAPAEISLSVAGQSTFVAPDPHPVMALSSESKPSHEDQPASVTGIGAVKLNTVSAVANETKVVIRGPGVGSNTKGNTEQLRESSNAGEVEDLTSVVKAEVDRTTEKNGSPSFVATLVSVPGAQVLTPPPPHPGTPAGTSGEEPVLRSSNAATVSVVTDAVTSVGTGKRAVEPEPVLPSSANIRTGTATEIQIASAHSSAEMQSGNVTTMVAHVASLPESRIVRSAEQLSTAGTRAGADEPSLRASGGLEHLTLVATPNVLEVGLASGTNGWLKVRAEMDGTGGVSASVVANTASAVEALHKELPALSAYLKDESVGVSSLVVNRAETGPMTQNAASGSGPGNFGQGGFGAGSDSRGRQDEATAHAIDSVAPESVEQRLRNVQFDASGAVSPATSYQTGSGGWLNVVA